jgi:hypothetical protein
VQSSFPKLANGGDGISVLFTGRKQWVECTYTYIQIAANGSVLGVELEGKSWDKLFVCNGTLPRILLPLLLLE